MDAPTARWFLCAACQRHVPICSHCDRGNIYCRDCAPTLRRQRVRVAHKKYRDSPRGHLKNAADQARYRARQRCLPRKLVRDQGSTPKSSCCSLPEVPSPCIQVSVACHFCYRPVSTWLRRRFLRHGREKMTPRRPLRGGVP